VTTPIMDALDIIRKRAEDADVDFLRDTLQVVLQAVMDADVSQYQTPLAWLEDHRKQKTSSDQQVAARLPLPNADSSTRNRHHV